MGLAILDAPQASGAAYSTAPPVTERNKFPYRSLDLAAARGEQTRTLLPFCYHFIALMAAVRKLSATPGISTGSDWRHEHRPRSRPRITWCRWRSWPSDEPKPAKVAPQQPVVPLNGEFLSDFGDRYDSERFRFPPRTWAPFARTLSSSSGDLSSRVGRTERDMMHPHFPSPLPVAVPDIGFAQSISIGPKALDSSRFADVPGDPCGLARQPLDRVVWLPSLRSWFALHS